MFHALYRIILKDNVINSYKQCWKTMATYMTQHRGAISSEFYYNSKLNQCIIHSQWVSKATKEKNWPLPPNQTPQELLNAENEMRESKISSTTNLLITDINFSDKQLIIKSENITFEKQEQIISKKTNILIFNDIGCGSDSVQTTFNTLMSSIDTTVCKILIVDAAYLRNTNWEEKARLLIIPGGRARPYYTALGSVWNQEEVEKGQFRVLKDVGDGNERIKKFVEAGGNFMGICAGAYYASSQTIFEKNGKHEVLDEGPLKFFSGIAEGPAYGLNKFEYKSEIGSEVALISSEKLAIKKLPTYFHGGCYFHMDNQTISEEIVLAEYQNLSPMTTSNNNTTQPVAIIEIPVGSGKAILSGVHIEHPSQDDNLLPAVKEGLAGSDQDRLLVFAKLVQRLNVPLSPKILNELDINNISSPVNTSKNPSMLFNKKIITDTPLNPTQTTQHNLTN